MKHLFSLKENYLYFDNAASTPPFKEITKKISKFLETYGSIHRGDSFMSKKSTKIYESSREYISKIYGNEDKDVIFTSNTTDSINKLSLLLDLKDKIILTKDIEHSSNVLPWVQRAKKVKYLQTTFPEFKIDLKELEELLKTREIYLFTYAIASNITGVKYSLEEIKNIYNLCKKYNVLVALDGSQYVAHNKPFGEYFDALSFAGHKMYAPFGGGVLIITKELSKNTNNMITGGGNIKYVDIYNNKIDYKNSPYKFETGTPNAIGAISIAESLKILEKIGWDKIENHSKEISGYFQNNFQEIDLLKGVEKHSPILLLKKNKENIYKLRKNNVAFRIGEFCVFNFLNKINEKEVIRISGGLMNNKEDLNKLKNILK